MGEIMKYIRRIVVHHSASNNPEHDDIRVIDEWHKERGWRQVGYHFFIQKDGWTQMGRMENKQGAGVKRYNEHSIHICLSGDAKFTLSQIISLDSLVSSLKERYPNVKAIKGHKHYNPTTECPGMDICGSTGEYIWGPDKLLKRVDYEEE